MYLFLVIIVFYTCSAKFLYCFYQKKWFPWCIFHPLYLKMTPDLGWPAIHIKPGCTFHCLSTSYSSCLLNRCMLLHDISVYFPCIPSFHTLSRTLQLCRAHNKQLLFKWMRFNNTLYDCMDKWCYNDLTVLIIRGQVFLYTLGCFNKDLFSQVRSVVCMCTVSLSCCLN